MPETRVTGADVVRTVLSFVKTIDQATPEEAVEVLAFLRGFVAAAGQEAEKNHALDAMAPDTPTPS